MLPLISSMQRVLLGSADSVFQSEEYRSESLYDDINFNEAAAVEDLGPPSMNKQLQDRFKNVFLNPATIHPRYISLPLDWRIVDRCDDPRGAGSCGDESTTVAYTLNHDLDEPCTPSINFCPEYFN